MGSLFLSALGWLTLVGLLIVPQCHSTTVGIANEIYQDNAEVMKESIISTLDIKDKFDYGEIVESSSLHPETSTKESINEEANSESRVGEDESWIYRLIGGFGYSFSFIFLSEIGDKTFLFVIIYSTRMNALKLFLLASLVLCSMHVVGVALGGTIQLLFSTFWIKMITIAAFFLFGVFLLYNAFTEEEEEEDYYVKIKEVEEEAHINAIHDRDQEFFGTEGEGHDENDLENQDAPEVEPQGFLSK
mmetsp:Transcript_27512/g.27393  ORF Transcript_27512/g.27393 Transcript_27512/m.27393 type:complete len:246 (+) Transcript_27512:17-754(+)